MARLPFVPRAGLVRPPHIYRSLFIQDDLAPQRMEAYKILCESQVFYKDYDKNQNHDLVDENFAKWMVSRIDHTTLWPNQGETKEWMDRMVEESFEPYKTYGICANINTNQKLSKLGPIVEEYAKHPQYPFAATFNFPHGDFSLARAEKQFRDFADSNAHIPNPKEADPVTNYDAWMKGDFTKVEDSLALYARLCEEYGYIMKPILKVSVHAMAALNTTYGADTFRSIYDMTRMVLKHGGNPKTSTGQAAKAPYHKFCSKDVGHIALALPMMIATRDHNIEHGTSYFNKFSGGHESEIDGIVFRHAMQNINAERPELVDKMVFGANYFLRKRLLDYIALQQGDECEFDTKYLNIPGYDETHITPIYGGLPDYRDPELDTPEPQLTHAPTPA